MSLTLTKDPMSQNQTKYINVMHHHICGLIEDRKLAIDWIESFAMLADVLIKVLSIAFFKKH